MDKAVKNELVSPSRLLKIFQEASAQRKISNGAKSENRQGSEMLLPGEVLEYQQENATCVGTLSNVATGNLYVTNYRLIFKGAFCHNPNDDGPSGLDQDEITKRGYRYQNKRYRLPKVNSGIKKIHSIIGQSVKKKGKSIKLSFGKHQSYEAEEKASRTKENDENYLTLGEREVELLRMRLGSHVTLEKINLFESDNDDGVIADCFENVSISLPIISIHDVKKFPKQFLDKEKLMMLRDGIEVTCNNLTSVKFCIGNSEVGNVEELLSFLNDRLMRQKSASAFAYVYAAGLKIPESCRAVVQDRTSPNFYNFEDEVNRLKLNQNRHLEIVDQSFCPQYPRHVIVPSTVNNREELRKLADFHRNNCFPIVTWRSSSSGGFLLRSSIPCTLRGLTDQRCEADEKLINELRSLTSSRDAKVWIFTEKPKISPPSSNTNQGGLKVSDGEAYYYPHCTFVNDELPDIQSVQQSGFKLMNALSYKTDDSKYLSQLEDSGWLGSIRRLLEIASAIASEIENEKSTVLVAYDDGVDKTSQIVSLVQLLLDPYYRTLSGFQVLIQKEWLSIRHPFFSRNLSTGINDDDLSPIFLQFLDCVWQLTRQFPLSFQFNEHLLETLAIHSYSGRFGTFLDYETNGIVGENPVSFWTWLNVVTMAKDDFFNSNFNENENIGPIFPVVAAPWMRLWTWHYRYKTEDTLVLAQHIGYMQLEKLQREYNDRLEEYQSLLKQLSDIDAISANQYAFHTRSSESILIPRSASCATNYSYHLEMNNDHKSKISLKSVFSRKAKSFDSLQALTSKDRKGKSQFYDDVDAENNEKSAIGTFPRSEMIRRHGNLRTALSENGIKFIGVSEVKVTEKTCSGYLVKQGKVRKSWKRRWFVLDARKGCVAYFEDHVSDQPKGVFKCALITQVYPHRNQDKNPNLFYIDTIDRRYATEAPNINAMKVWLGCYNAILT